MRIMNGMYKSLLEKTANTRDLGGYECSWGVTEKLRVLRSDVPKALSANDITFLLANDITTIIDMREDEAVAETKSAFEDLEGFSYIRCPIVEGSIIADSPEAVPGLYVQIAESHGAIKVFRTIAASAHGVLFNCHAGKDRTGVIAAVLLKLAGVSDRDIIENYMLTKLYRSARVAEVQDRNPDMARIVVPRTSYIEIFLRIMHDKYGTAESYLRAVGMSGYETERLKMILNKKSEV